MEKKLNMNGKIYLGDFGDISIGVDIHDCVEKSFHELFLSFLAVQKKTTYYLFHYI
jgi:hypothetical protein